MAMKTTLNIDKTRRGKPMKGSGFDEKFWRDRFPSEPYTVDSDQFDDYVPAYRLGTSLRGDTDDFELKEGDIRKKWESAKGKSKLGWDQAKEAVRSAWEFDRSASDITDPERSD
jgi:hypothetical protein